MPNKKYKVIVLCDHPLSTSGVGVQANMLLTGLIRTGKYSFRSLGAAIKHQNYEVVAPTPDLIIKPTDGFGTKEQLRQMLVTEEPDALFLFTDPRQFYWVWEMEDEIRQVCPITYWHVWDNDPYPEFNNVWYESTDLINCLSDKTFDLVKPRFPEKTNYIPHTWPPEVFHKLPDDVAAQAKASYFGDMQDWFMALWVNRNAHRKLPGDLLVAWKQFLDRLQAIHGHKKAFLLMHTDPKDTEGADLPSVTDMLGISGNVVFSPKQLENKDLNVLYNVADVTVNIAKAEGFGLSLLSSLMTGTPVIAKMTGGMTRQVKNHSTGFEYGVALPVTARNMMSNLSFPYIFDDYCSHEAVADAFMKMFETPKWKRDAIGEAGMIYAAENFSYDKMIADWDRTLETEILKFRSKNGADRWTCQPLNEPLLPVVPMPNSPLFKLNQPRGSAR